MANKKIFDITPPQATQKFPEPPKIIKKNAKKSLLLKKPIFIAAGVLLAGVFGFIFIKPEVELEIWPVKETVEFKTQFASAGEVLTQTQLTSQDFVSTGKTVKAEKAEGVVRVYNNYALSQTLVQNTRLWCFEGDELREFKTKQKVVVPSQKQLDVPVIASSAGAEYNIEPCTFSIPGLKGSPRYTAVYGKSALPMNGGIKAETTVVSQEDLDKAEGLVIEKALADSESSLKNSISLQDYVLLEEALETAILEAKPLTEVGKNVANFTFQAEAEAKALVFKKAELAEFAKSYAQSQLAQGKVLVESSLILSYTLKSADFSLREMVLDLEISAATYRTLDENSIKESIKNIKVDNVILALNKFPEIARAQVRLWPFWNSFVPNDPSRIKIKLNLDLD